MKLRAITHGRKAEGANPGLTEEGKKEIEAKAHLINPDNVTGIVVGTGRRFFDTLTAIGANLKPDLSLKVCPVLGSADSGKRAESGWDVILSDGQEIKAGGYLGLIDSLPASALWSFLELFQEGNLLVTGRELIGALVGSNDKAQSATLYEIDVTSKTVTEIQ